MVVVVDDTVSLLAVCSETEINKYYSVPINGTNSNNASVIFGGCSVDVLDYSILITPSTIRMLLLIGGQPDFLLPADDG